MPARAETGIAVGGTAAPWLDVFNEPSLPGLDVFNQQSRYADIFNRASIPFSFSVETGAPWILATPQSGKVEKDQRSG